MGDEALRWRDVNKPGPLLRLVHSFERRRAGWPFVLRMTLRRGCSQVITSIRQPCLGPRAFVVGAGNRVDLALPEDDGNPVMPRHVAVVAVPRADGVSLRAFSLHPDRSLHIHEREHGGRGEPAAPLTSDDGAHAPADAMDEDDAPGRRCGGGVLARGALRLGFDGFTFDVEASLDPPGAQEQPAATLQVYPPGQQLSFYAGASIRHIGDVVSSVSGPAGGAAIPALVYSVDEQSALGGTLVLRSRSGVYRAEVSADELARGLLIGRSRRCVLGRGFDENDGLSRVHALVIGLDEGVFAFDLASRYGLRDVSRPNQLARTSRLDDGVGCLVYGAGYLTFEA